MKLLLKRIKATMEPILLNRIINLFYRITNLRMIKVTEIPILSKNHWKSLSSNFLEYLPSFRQSLAGGMNHIFVAFVNIASHNPYDIFMSSVTFLMTILLLLSTVSSIFPNLIGDGRANLTSFFKSHRRS